MRTIDRIKKKCIEGGIDCFLKRAENSRVYDLKLDGAVEAKLVTLCYSSPPADRFRVTARLLSTRWLIHSMYFACICSSHFKKTNLSLVKSKVVHRVS